LARDPKGDHQAFIRQFIFEIKGGKHRIVETIAGEKRSCRQPANSFNLSERRNLIDGLPGCRG
jgi:hypothetical protein